jgi:hypothetical protein
MRCGSGYRPLTNGSGSGSPTLGLTITDFFPVKYKFASILILILQYFISYKGKKLIYFFFSTRKKDTLLRSGGKNRVPYKYCYKRTSRNEILPVVPRN